MRKTVTIHVAICDHRGCYSKLEASSAVALDEEISVASWITDRDRHFCCSAHEAWTPRPPAPPQPEPVKPAPVVDLLAALEESVAAAKAARLAREDKNR